MRDSFIKIRIATADKIKIEQFALSQSKTISEVLRYAASCAIKGHNPGEFERQALVDVRRQANGLLAILERDDVSLPSLRSALGVLRKSVRTLVLRP